MENDYPFIKNLRTALQIIAVAIIIGAFICICWVISGLLDQSIEKNEAMSIIVYMLILGSVSPVILLSISELLLIMIRIEHNSRPVVNEKVNTAWNKKTNADWLSWLQANPGKTFENYYDEVNKNEVIH